MSITNNWHCDLCDARWNNQIFPPSDLIGVKKEFGRPLSLGDPTGEHTYKHLCRNCLTMIVENMRRICSINYDFKNISTYFTQDEISKREPEAT